MASPLFDHAKLSVPDYEALKDLLHHFSKGWKPGKIDDVIENLSGESDELRRVAEFQLVKVDLMLCWKSGREQLVERYLSICNDLGTEGIVPVELIYTEYEARRQADQPADLSEFRTRFPLQFDELETLVTLGQTIVPDRSESYRDTRQSDDVSEGSTNSGPRMNESFGRYRINKLLGQGMMGAVYLAYDTRLGRRVALKTPSFGPRPDRAIIKRFYREAQSAGTIRHPNICPVYDVGQIDGVHFISMAYIKGRPLSAFIRADKPIRNKTVALIVRKLALALAEAHANGIVHRDLKPDNIMIDEKSEPVLTDFGLAHKIASKDESRVTKQGMILGSPGYMSPEQVEGNLANIGPSSDIYSLGVILYELLTCELPLVDTSLVSLLYRIVNVEPRRPAEVRPDADPVLEHICMRMMEKRAEDRFGSMKDVARELSTYVTHLTSPSEDKTGRDGLVVKQAHGSDVGSTSPAPSPLPQSIDADAGIAKNTLPINDQSQPRQRRIWPVSIKVAVQTICAEVRRIAIATSALPRRLSRVQCLRRMRTDRHAERPFRGVAELITSWIVAILTSIGFGVGLAVIGLRGSRLLANTTDIAPYGWMAVVVLLSALGILLLGKYWELDNGCRPEELADRVLVDLANLRRGPDNTTVVTVDINEELAGSQKPIKRKYIRTNPAVSPVLVGSTLTFCACSVALGVLKAWGSMVVAIMLGLIAADICLGQFIRNRNAMTGRPSSIGRGQSLRRRLVLAGLGAGVGCAAYVIARFLLLPLDQGLAREVDATTLPQAFYRDGGPTVSAMMAHFSLLFAILRWWRLVEPLRRRRLSLWSVAAAFLAEWAVHQVLPIPQPAGFMIACGIALTVQVSASRINPTDL